MSKLKKLIAGISAFAVLSTQAMTAVVYGATGLNDPEFDKALSWMYSNGLTKYNTADAFRPYDTLTREQAAKFYSEFAKKVLGSTPSSEEATFTDMADADASLVDSIKESFQLGLFKGTEGKFYPTAPLTKAASLAVLVRAMSGSMDENVEPWWKNYFQKARELGLTKESDVMALDRPVTRYEIALMLYRASGDQASETSDSDLGSLLDSLLGDSTATDTGTTGTDTDTGTTGTDTDTGSTGTGTTSSVEGNGLEIALDANTPKNQYVPGTGSQIKVMKIDFMAGSSDVTMKAITVKLEGLATKSKINNVYLVDEDGKVVTSQRSFNTDYLARLVFDSNYKVSANTIQQLYVAVDLVGAANELFTFSIPSAESVESDVDVSGSFPITSYTTQGTSYSSQTIKFYSLQSTSLTSSAPSGTVYVGDTNKEVFRFTLEMPSGNNRDVSLKSVSFRANNTIENILDNVQLIAGGSNIAKSVVIDGRNITITTDYVLTYGSNKVFTMFADIVGGENNRNDIQLYLNQSSDIVAIENETNAATSIDTTTYNKVYGNYYILKEGDNLISKSSETPTASNIPSNQKDNLVLAATANFPNPIKVDKIRVYFTGTSVSTSVDKLRLYINDKFIDEASSFSVSGTQLYAQFNYYDTIGASTKIQVKVNTQVSATVGATISDVTLDASSIVFAGNTAQFQNSQNNVAISDIKGSAVSPTFTVAAPTLQAVQRNDGLTTAEQIVAGVQGMRAIKFSVQNNNVRDLTINGFTVTYSGTSAGASFISNLKVATGSDTSSVISTNNFGGGAATFTTLGITVPKGETKDISLFVDVGSGFPANGSFQLAIDNFDVQDVDGNSVTVNSSTTTGIPTYSSTFTVIAGGVLYAKMNTTLNTDVSKIIPGNSNAGAEQIIATFNFKSTKDDSLISELSIGNIGFNTIAANSALTSLNSSVVTSAADNVISNLYIYDSSNNLLGSATMVNGYAHFSFGTSVSLPRDTEVNLIVKAKVSNISDISLSNLPLNFALVAAGTSNAIGINKTKIVSASNGNEVSSISYTTVYGLVKVLRATTLTLANASQTTTSLAGSQPIYSFTATADAAKTAKLKEFHLDVNVTDSTTDSTGFNINDFKLYINNGLVSSTNVTFKSATGNCASNVGSAISNTNPTLAGGTNSSQAYCLAIVMTGDYIDGYDLSAGTTATFRVNAQSNVEARNDTVTTQMNAVNSSTTTAAPAYVYGAAGTDTVAASIIWSDNSANTSSPLTTQYWFTDQYLKTVGDLTSWTLSKS